MSSEREDRLRRRVVSVLIEACFDCGHIADQVTSIVEKSVRRRFGLTAAQFEFDFRDMTRDVECMLADQLQAVLDFDSAVDTVVIEFLDSEGKGDARQPALDHAQP
jgi:hypothetical protein